MRWGAHSDEVRARARPHDQPRAARRAVPAGRRRRAEAAEPAAARVAHVSGARRPLHARPRGHPVLGRTGRIERAPQPAARAGAVARCRPGSRARGWRRQPGTRACGDDRRRIVPSFRRAGCAGAGNGCVSRPARRRFCAGRRAAIRRMAAAPPRRAGAPLARRAGEDGATRGGARRCARGARVPCAPARRRSAAGSALRRADAAALPARRTRGGTRYVRTLPPRAARRAGPGSAAGNRRARRTHPRRREACAADDARGGGMGSL